MADVLDVLFRIRDMAAVAAHDLRISIAEAQAVLEKLDEFATDSEDIAQLAAASDIMPTYRASIPERSGLVKRQSEETS